MFVDKAKIMIQAGKGGDGAVAFHREKYVSRGGPDGGDGGNGGSIVFEAKGNMHTLLDFRYHRKFKAASGENGRGGNMSGKRGEDLVIYVPPGTVVKDEQGRIIADLFREGERRVVLRGGRGGRGNARFATPTRQAPRFAQPGEKTVEYTVTLELKTIADVGLIGFPNVGKSTILSVVSAARPKIADYHFTTLSPNLGVVKVDSHSFVMADIPGLIEGAHEGMGLGHDFLRHVERTRLLVHVIDVSGWEGRDPVEDFKKINAELTQFSDELAGRPQIAVANKSDLPDADEHFEALKAHLGPLGIPLFKLSAATHQGFEPLLREIVRQLEALPPVHNYVEQERELLPPVKRELQITPLEEFYLVEGDEVERLIGRVNFEDYDSIQYFQRQLRDMGVIDALKAAGAGEGDTIRIEEMEFDFVE
ncbi:GTPase ObgE [Luoshenia tenuis]|jgi:GTP-binding protein|uniref:GTPase ObgE n=1 Tax=Luoshenia tenuis TaxID=2763654 RepID=UPI003D89FD7F